jgi:hypothetical protein
VVPISTIDWLVSRESPAARWVALRDLLGRPAKDVELRKARQALPRDLFIRDTVAALRRALSGSGGRNADAPLWLTLFLAEVGVDDSLPEVRRAADVLFSTFERSFVQIERSEGAKTDPVLFPVVCRTLALVGHAEDPRILSAAEHVARRRIAGTSDPASPVAIAALAKELLLYAVLPEKKRGDLVERAIGFGVQRAIATALPHELKPLPRGARGFAFPTADGTDLLELLLALVQLKVEASAGLAPALALLAAEADRRARWRLGAAPRDRMPVALEREGELSRWVTIRALRVMQHFRGLTVGEKG